MILGGIKSIARVTEWLVPFMAILYLGGGLIVLVLYAGRLPHAIGLVLDGAFTGSAAAGGFAGSTIMMAMRYGIARGLFSNEAGLGSAPMVHAAADTDHPVRQGMYGIFEVFVDTILICSTTALVILVTDTWSSGLTGAALSAKAFETGLPGTFGDIVVTGGLLLFAFSTLIGWSYYGETGIVYLLGTQGGAALPAAVAGVRVSRRDGLAPPRLGRGGHPEWPDGHPEPHRGAGVHSSPAETPTGVLQQALGPVT